jgi:hypothetical protein
MEIENILHELRYLETGHFPREALEAAIAQRETITPHLLQALEDAPRLLERLVAEEDCMLPLYAFYLLAQFRETRAYPLIVAFFSQPGDLPVDVMGDFVTEDLGRVLASVSGGDPEPMKTLIENPRVNEYTRNSAMGGLITLFVEDVLPREAVIAYFRELFQGGLERDYSYAWDGLVSQSTRLYPKELMPEIRQAFADDLVDDVMSIDLAWIEQVLDEGKAETLARLRANRHYHYVEDTIQEMEWWACFQPPRPKPPPAPPQRSSPASSAVMPRPAPLPKKKKVGRNDPCPCGSGRKYKHCCGKPGR